MADVGEQGERRGLSRRDLIKASAVAGAAAWTAPVIIDSLASPAAAASIPPIKVSCSWFYAVYQKPGDSTYYFTSADDSNANCNNAQPPNNSGLRSITCNGVTYTLPDGGTVPTAGGFSAVKDTSCSNFIVISGSTIYAKGGATLLAGFSHPSNPSVCSPCPSATSNNTLTVCNSTSSCN